MRRSIGKPTRLPRNQSLARILSLSLSTALVLIPVWPVTGAGARAASEGRAPAPDSAGAARHFAASAAPAAPLAPSLTATKTDSFADPDGDGKAEPGQIITYTVTITNNGPDDATNVQFTDTVDPNTTLVPGSVATQPIASGDSYNVLGNVRIQPGAAAGLLANDCDPDNGGPCSSAGLTASGPSTSAQGGDVTVNPNGSFSYNPPAGFEGADSFTYTVTDPTGQTDTATATFTVNEVVWFVDNTAPAGGDGRLTNPYSSLASLNSGSDLDEPSDFIFVYEGAGAYGGGIALEDSQRLIGQGTGLDAALAGFGVSAPPHSDPRPAATSSPTLANVAGHVITLANGNAVLHLNAAASAAAASAVFGSGVSGAHLANVGASASGSANGVSLINYGGDPPMLPTMLNSSVACSSTGTAVVVSGGATGLTFNNTDVSQNGGRVVDIQNRTGGAVTFDAASSVTGTSGATDAVVLLGNTGGATVTFAGPVQLNTNAAGARGLVADSAGSFTLNMSNSGNAVSSTGGAAVDIEDVSVNINFATTFSTNSGANGVRVHNVAGIAFFGNAAVNGSAGAGVLLTNNSAALSFSDLDIAPAASQRALHATGNTGAISSTSGVISTTGAAAVEIAGTAPANRTPLNIQLTSVSASGGPNGIFLNNTSATGSPGGFSVVGTGVAPCTQATPTCTGGQIQNTTGADGGTGGTGVRLVNADSVSLDEVRLNDHQNFAIYGNNVNGFTLSNSYVHGVNGTNAGAPQEGSVSFDNLAGSAAITNSDIGGGKRDNVRVVNTQGTLDRLTVSGTTIRFHDAATGVDAVHFEGSGAGTVMKLTVTGGSFQGARGDMIDALAQTGVTMDVVIRSNTFTNEQAGVISGNTPIIVQGSGTVTYDISCNSVQQTNAAGTTGTAQGHGINVAKSTAGGNFSGTIFNNRVGKTGVLSSGAGPAGAGLQLLFNGTGTHTSLVKNNVFRNYGEAAVRIVGNSGNATANVTMVGNTATEPDPIFTFAGLFADIGALGADTNTLNLKFGGAGAEENDFTNSEPFDFSDVFLSVNTAGAKIDLSRGVSASSDLQQIITDNNVDPVFAFGSGTILFVNTVPLLPAAVDQTCLPPVASLSPADSTLAPAGADVQVAASGPSASGFSADRGFAVTQPALRKIQPGRAHSERARLLDVGDAQPEQPLAALMTAPLATLAGETVSINIGTLRAGDSVTITFQVEVSDPFTGMQPQVSNQGTVTADGGISVLTDDPSEPGGADPTVTPILLPPTINVNDATATEPASGSTDALFTVTLSHPFTQTVTVNFATANGGANPATAGTDYTTTNGTVTFAVGETVQTVSVPVLADGDAGEADETFLVNLSAPVNGTVGDGQATGTITDESVASPVVISELRTSGPNGAGDDFVELLNATDADITVMSSDGSPGWAVVKSGSDCSTTPVVVAVIPNGTVIPARGNYLLVGSTYSLGAYAAGDQTLTADIEDDRNVGLFTTASLANLSSVNRYDAVGFGANTGNNCDLLREGDTLPPAAGSTSEYSFVRKVSKGQTQDTSDNAADFVVVSTTPSVLVGGNTPVLGAPGPEGSGNPRGPVPCAAPSGAALFGRELIDPSVSAASAPNVVRDATPDAPNNSTFGTLDFRRTFTNNTGGAVTALRFRVIDLSTFPAAGTADLRARTSSAIVVTTGMGNKTVLGTTLEQPPAQALGGGVNSSLAAGAVTLGTPLASGASVNLRFLFGVEQVGDYDIAFVLEASPGPTGKDFWRLTGHTETGGHTDAGCNRPPVADAGQDQTVECEGGQASVTLDGSGSTDPDGDTPLTFEWSEGMTQLGTGQTLNVTLPTGSHTITLTVTDPSGDSSQDTVIVNVVDTTAPVVNDPPDVTVFTGPGATSCGTVVSDEALGTATAEDGCEGSLPVNRTGVPAGNFFPVGTTQVTYTATDAAGNTGMATQNVTVVDNTPPVVTPPPNVVAPADAGSCSAEVDPGTATATDNCAVDTIVGTRSDNQPLDAPYPVGTTTITWTATDASGNTASAQQTVTVQDTQPPALTSSVAVTTMGPPFNHALINVGLAATATDNCSFLGPFQVFVYSDEDDGAAPHSPDAVDIGLGTLRLRRERDGGLDGRVYLVVVKVSDASGNTSASCSTVTVPLSNSAGDQSAVNAQAAAAAAFCSANNGAAPAGYFVVGP